MNNPAIVAAALALLLSLMLIGDVSTQPSGAGAPVAIQPTTAAAAQPTSPQEGVPPPETQAAIRDVVWGYSGYVLLLTLVVLAGIIALHRTTRAQRER
jgi:hypothetical protein